MIKDLIKKVNKYNLIQLIKFALVGFSNAVVLFLVYNGLLLLGVNYQIAYAIGFILSVLNAYFWNNRYVFHDKTSSFVQKIIKVYASYIFTYILSAILLYVWIQMVGVPKEIAPIINIVITTPVNFLLNKLWAFRNKKNKSE